MYLCIFFWNWLWPDRQFAAPGTKCRWHHRHVELAGLLRDYQYVGRIRRRQFFRWPNDWVGVRHHRPSQEDAQHFI